MKFFASHYTIHSFHSTQQTLVLRLCWLALAWWGKKAEIVIIFSEKKREMKESRDSDDDQKASFSRLFYTSFCLFVELIILLDLSHFSNLSGYCSCVYYFKQFLALFFFNWFLVGVSPLPAEVVFPLHHTLHSLFHQLVEFFSLWIPLLTRDTCESFHSAYIHFVRAK